jgi:hypothetical protein
MIIKERKQIKFRKLLSIFILAISLLFIQIITPAWAMYTYTELLPSDFTEAWSSDINVSGVVVGSGYSIDDIGKGFIYDKGTYTELLPDGWDSAEASGINNSGAVVGSGYIGDIGKGFIYHNGTYTELLPDGWDWAFASGINDSGVVVGYGYITLGEGNYIQKGFIYDNGTYTELLHPDWHRAFAYKINKSGVVVGECEDATSIYKGFIAIPSKKGK